MTLTPLRLAAALLSSVLLYGGSTVPAHQPPARRDPGVAYLPLRAGTRLIYKGDDGQPFSLTYGEPIDVDWFDGTSRRVVPVVDTKCGCQVLFQNAGGEIRAIGAIRAGAIERWGEYYVIWPGSTTGPTETVTTPAGRFEQAVRVTTPDGTVWFARDVGIVKTDHYALQSIETPNGG